MNDVIFIGFFVIFLVTVLYAVWNYRMEQAARDAPPHLCIHCKFYSSYVGRPQKCSRNGLKISNWETGEKTGWVDCSLNKDGMCPHFKSIFNESVY